MFESHTKGIPIARPMFFSFPQDTTTYEISSQFLLGKGVLVSPVLEQGADSVTAYFPAGNWFDLFNHSRSLTTARGEYLKLDAPADRINVHLREGNILPMQGEAMTTGEARKTPFRLVVAFSQGGNSSGEVFLDDGDDLEVGGKGGRWSFVRFNSGLVNNSLVLESKVVNGGFAQRQKWIVGEVIFVGLKSDFKSVGRSEIVRGVRTEETELEIKSVENEDGFVTLEVSKLSLLVGKDFGLEISHS